MLEFDPDFYDLKSEIQFKLGLKTLKELNVKDGETILDVGCGTGRLTFEIAKENLSGMVIGLDINPKMIKKANDNLQKSGLKNIKFITTGILQYQPDIQFDAVFSNSTLHWIKKTRDLYQKIYSILLPGGRLVAQIPTTGGYSQLATYFMQPIQPLNLSTYFKNWEYPIKLVNPNTLKRILTSIGYNDIKVWVEKREVKHKTPEDLLDFLRSAALVPMLSQLPPEKQKLYLNSLLTFFKSKENLNLHITMERLFLNVKK